MDPIDEIKQKLDIVDLVGSYLETKKAGRNYKANCPFHSEKTPSFMLSPELQIYKCFGCGESGDIFNFHQKIEGIEFGKSLEVLAERVGVKLPERSSDPNAVKKKTIFELNHLASKYFHYILTQHKVGKKALEYLKEGRGLTSKTIKDFTSLEKIYTRLCSESLMHSMQLIKTNLELLGIKHNNFVYESKLIKKNEVSKVVKKLKKENYIYEGKLDVPKGEQTKDWKIRDQLLFKSTLFGDDTDRPLQKADGTWTYFAGDVAYHSYKISRKFDILINILGADHAGYTKRIISATNAISKNKVNLICKVSQLVKLFKDGKPFKMSKRKGDYITVEDLIKEVGRDSTRFMMLNRSNDVELDFDFKKVTEKSKDNPVFYVQYAYARINSIFRLLKLDLKKNIKLDTKNFTLNRYEIEILKKISEWPKCVELSSTRLEPHRIPFYLYELVTLFHSYWNMGKDNKEFRFVPERENINNPRLVVLQALSIVIKNGMFILGVSAPSSM